MMCEREKCASARAGRCGVYSTCSTSSAVTTDPLPPPSAPVPAGTTMALFLMTKKSHVSGRKLCVVPYSQQGLATARHDRITETLIRVCVSFLSPSPSLLLLHVHLPLLHLHCRNFSKSSFCTVEARNHGFTCADRRAEEEQRQRAEAWFAGRLCKMLELRHRGFAPSHALIARSGRPDGLEADCGAVRLAGACRQHPAGVSFRAHHEPDRQCTRSTNHGTDV